MSAFAASPPGQAEGNSLESRAAEAKRQGLQEINLGFTIPMRLRTRSLEEALEKLDVVLAQSVEERTLVENETDLVTWQRFLALKLYRRRPPGRLIPFFDPASSSYGDELAPGYFLIKSRSGELVIDGVTLRSSEDGFPRFEPGRIYLLFLEFDESRRFANLPVGDAGAFRIRGDRIESAGGTELGRNPIGFDLEMRYALSLQRFEEAIASSER